MYKGVRLYMMVAVAKNNVIGYKNRLPWKMPADLKRYKDCTWGLPMIMGRNTFHSINREAKTLPGRHHAVISRTMLQPPSMRGISVHQSMNAACKYVSKKLLASTACVIGGEAIYEMALPWIDVIYMTRIHKEFQGDTHFHFVPKEPMWKMVLDQRFERDEKNEAAYTFFVYEKCS